MLKITRSRWIPFTPDSVYAVLTEPNNLSQVVKRIEGITVLERQGDFGRVMAKIDLPGGQWMESEGVVNGMAGEWLTFNTNKPFPLESHWELEPQLQDDVEGTLVTSSLALDLGTVASFWSSLMLKGYLSAELDGDLFRLEALVHQEDQLA